jgi:glucose-1-phosphate cytidylyltransferase
MKVVILCGGLGTRLREETEFRPKPMVPVGGRPILWHIMKNYAAQGHKEFILCLGYKGEVIRDFFRNYQWNTSDVTLKLGSSPQITYHTQHDEEDWTVTLLETGEDTMTGGRLKCALPYVGEGTFLFTYGDGVADVDVNAALSSHHKNGSLATITAVRPAGRFGDIVIEGGRVTRFHEKPATAASPINGGFMVLEPGIGAYLSGDRSVLETDALPKLAHEGKMGAHEHPGFWQCMDTFREQMMLEDLWKSGRAPWKNW